MIGLAPQRRWLPLVGATVALLLTLAACGDDDSAATTTPGGDTATTAQPNTTAAADDQMLVSAVDAVGDRFAFTATITLDDAVVTEVDGLVHDGVGAYTVVSGGSTVEYVVSDRGQWARQATGDWMPLADAAPLADPLEPLRHPIAVDVRQDAGEGTVVDATYDGAALGFADGGEVSVTITISSGAVTRIAYDVPIDDGIATVVTTFDPTADVSPIQIPPT